MLPVLITAILMAMSGAAATPAEREASPFTVLDGHQAEVLSKQCSRDNPPRFDGTWRPSQQDITDVEAQLPQLHGLRAALCCIPGARVTNVHDYYRQYVGLIVGGHNVIYVNAFAARLRQLFDPDDRWRTEPVMACDGGEAFWGAIYDPATKTFSSLAFNGQS